MPLTTRHDAAPRPPSPWSGSSHRTRHRWQLEPSGSVAEAAHALRALADELTAAHAAGWWLTEPMTSGHLLAARASRRRRGRGAPDPSAPPSSAPATATGTAPPAHRRRLRLVDEPPVDGEDFFDATAAAATPVLAWAAGAIEQVSGPGAAPDLLAEVARQTAPEDMAPRLWGVASARVGPGIDLVADGSALRLHTVHDGVLVRTQEALTFEHAADGAGTLLQAAAAYEALAGVLDAMAAAGGRLVVADEGFLQVAYDPSAARTSNPRITRPGAPARTAHRSGRPGR